MAGTRSPALAQAGAQLRSNMEQTSNVVAAGTVGVTVLGITIQDWAAILAAVWILLQMGWWIYTKIKNKE